MTYLRHRTIAQLLMIVSVALAAAPGCGPSNSPEQLAAVRVEVNAYCDCVLAAMNKSPEELRAARCKAEKDRFDAAWAQLPAAANEPKGEALHNAFGACWDLLWEAQQAVGQPADPSE